MKISERFMDVDVVNFDMQLPNLNGDKELSAEGFCGMELVEKPFERERDGRSGPDLRRLEFCQS